MAIKICLSFVSFLKSLFEELIAFLSGIGIFVFVMPNLFSLGVVCLGAASRILKSKIKETAAAVVVGVVGIGLLASPFLLQADDEEKTNDAPNVGCLWVANSGSIGFEVDFDVTAPSDSDKLLSGFQLKQDGQFVIKKEWVKSATLRSKYCDWLEIAGFDGGPPLPYPGYVHSFDFTIEGLELHSIVPLSPFPIQDVHSVVSSVSVQLYVEVNSNGSLRSMSAWAVDSDGDSYEIPVYYSAGGWDGPFYTLP